MYRICVPHKYSIIFDTVKSIKAFNTRGFCLNHGIEEVSIQDIEVQTVERI
jgi:hypothetical protein